MTERERIARLARHFGQGRGVRVGIGDDAAVIDVPDPGGAPLVWTIDTQVEGTHFRTSFVGWNDLGYRSFMAAASDLAAMGATPLAALSALALAGDVDDEALDALAAGQAEAARQVGAPIVGGNLSRARETSVTTTLLGSAARAVTRSGARPGDGVFVSGDLGKAAAGLALLESVASPSAPAVDLDDVQVSDCLRAWRRPEARIAAGLAMAATATAAIDVSDGLAGDAGHIAQASGVTLVLDEAALRDHACSRPLEAVAGLLGRDPLHFALYGGEDYALVVCGPTPIEGFVRIGDVEDGPAALLLRGADRSRTPLAARGFDHFRR